MHPCQLQHARNRKCLAYVVSNVSCPSGMCLQHVGSLLRGQNLLLRTAHEALDWNRRNTASRARGSLIHGFAPPWPVSLALDSCAGFKGVIQQAPGGAARLVLTLMALHSGCVT